MYSGSLTWKHSVGNIAHGHFSGELLGTRDLELYTEHEMYMILAILFVGMFFDVDPTKSFPLRQVCLRFDFNQDDIQPKRID
jgi:hypothetical protein